MGKFIECSTLRKSLETNILNIRDIVIIYQKYAYLKLSTQKLFMEDQTELVTHKLYSI